MAALCMLWLNNTWTMSALRCDAPAAFMRSVLPANALSLSTLAACAIACSIVLLIGVGLTVFPLVTLLLFDDSKSLGVSAPRRSPFAFANTKAARHRHDHST